MKADISRLSFDETKHYLNVFEQMGRLRLDADANEQAEIWLRRHQRQTADAIGEGSDNNGFRVDTLVLIDALETREAWNAEKPAPASPDPQLFVDYFAAAGVGRGALTTEGAVALKHTLARPLDWRGLERVLFAADAEMAVDPAHCRLWLSDGSIDATITPTELAKLGDWRQFEVAATALPAGLDLAHITGYGFAQLDATRRYRFDSIKADLPLRVLLVPTTRAGDFTAEPIGGTPAPVLAIDDDARLWGSTVLRVNNATRVDHVLPAVRDLSHVRRWLVPVKKPVPAFTFELRAGVTTPGLSAATTIDLGDWVVHAYTPTGPASDYQQIDTIRWDGLSDSEEYLLGPVFAQMELTDNLVIMGGDGTAEGAGRFYLDGLAASKEEHETYFSQRDLPEPDPAAFAPLAVDEARIDLAYLDMWERPVTFVEDPGTREIALEGTDTCTRTQLVAQVRLLTGTAVALPTEPSPPLSEFAALLPQGQGTLTTKDKPGVVADPCADPCEPPIAGPFLGEANRLFRVEIHSYGDIGADGAPGTATFKWSRENAAVVSPLIEDALAGVTSAVVEDAGRFQVGDLIELSDDLVDLVTGPYEDRANHRAHQRGELRRITSIDLDANRLSWADAGAPGPEHAPLVHDFRRAWHARVRRWDGLLSVTAGDIVLSDGVVIEFGGAQMLPGDFWLFATRVADRSVERLIETPPQGLRHRYVELARIHRRNDAGQVSISVEDRRARYDSLSRLTASAVAYDPGVCLGQHADWDDVHTVQQALDVICRHDLQADLRRHKRYLHGLGVVCGLQVRCDADRNNVRVFRGYAIDADGYDIFVDNPITVDVVAAAQAQGLLVGGNGEVCLTLARSVSAGAGAVVEIEPHIPQPFWDSVLEGTLIHDFYVDCIESLFNFFKAQLFPIPDDTIPVSLPHQRVLSLINLWAQYINSASGPYAFLSSREDALLRQFYADLKTHLASPNYCAMFDGLATFPDYPYVEPVGIDTAFGLFKFHHRLRRHPTRGFLYAYGSGNTIEVFDLATHALVELLTVPGGANLEVQDLVFADDGSEMYVVGILDGTDDSVFVNASINLTTQAHTWGPTTVVCDLEFVRLALHGNTLYAVAKSIGLYKFDPHSIPLVPPVPAGAYHFNATGLITLSSDGQVAFAAESSAPIGTSSATFFRIRRIDLVNNANPPLFFQAGGYDIGNDLTLHADLVYVTSDAPGPSKFLNGANATSGFDGGTGTPAFAAINLGNLEFTRLAVLPGAAPRPDYLLVSSSKAFLARRVDVSTPTAPVLEGNFRVPLQIMPSALALDPGATELYALNFLSNTISVVDVAIVFSATPPVYTNEPPTTLSTYRQDVLDAFSDLFGVLGQYMKDCFCSKFLVDCPPSDPDEKIYLGCVEIQGDKVYNICNLTKRHYVKSFDTWGYWLSTFPFLSLLKRSFAIFSCKVI